MKPILLTPLLFTASQALTVRQANNSSSGSFQSRCTSYRASGVTNVTFVNATYYPANASVYATSPQQTINTTILPAFCSKHARLMLDMADDDPRRIKSLDQYRQ